MEHFTDMLIQWDTALLLTLNALHTPYFDRFMMIYSGNWIWIPLYVSVFIMLYLRFGWKKAVILGLAIGICIFIADTTCAKILRPFFCRPRPGRPDSPISHLVHLINGYRGGHYGFPSCHAANSFALAAALIIICRCIRLSLFIIIWAIINSYSRIYLGVHYPGDILFGTSVGIAIAWLIILPITSHLNIDCRGSTKAIYPSPLDIPTTTGILTIISIGIISCHHV